MPNQITRTDLHVELQERLLPKLMLWNRLEGRPRTANFNHALKAEVRDALWMVTRQWQMGEYQWDDAGSPIFTKLHMATTQFTKYCPTSHPTGTGVTTLAGREPLEAKVERRPLPFTQGKQILALDLRLLMGRQWIKQVSKVGDYRAAYLARYPIHLPDPTEAEDAYLCAHPEVWQSFAAAAGRCMDGAALYFYIKASPSHHAYDGIAALEADKPRIDEQAGRFIRWFEKLFYQPEPSGPQAWTPDRLEYQFACSAPGDGGEKVFVADEYYHGHLDWYSIDIDATSAGLGPAVGEEPQQAPRPRSEIIPRFAREFCRYA